DFRQVGVSKIDDKLIMHLGARKAVTASSMVDLLAIINGCLRQTASGLESREEFLEFMCVFVWALVKTIRLYPCFEMNLKMTITPLVSKLLESNPNFEMDKSLIANYKGKMASLANLKHEDE
ncbi:hypothetical protein Ciccas_012906, partial [Cichlidogyrus casuarinus]